MTTPVQPRIHGDARSAPPPVGALGRRRRGTDDSLAAAAFALLLLLLLVAGCGEPAAGAAGAEVRALDRTYGCGTCHAIPGLAGANGRTGPPLTAMARQPYVAGVVPNTREALIRFIVDPAAIDPLSAMPDLDVAPAEAAILADYLRRVGGGR